MSEVVETFADLKARQTALAKEKKQLSTRYDAVTEELTAITQKIREVDAASVVAELKHFVRDIKTEHGPDSTYFFCVRAIDPAYENHVFVDFVCREANSVRLQHHSSMSALELLNDEYVHSSADLYEEALADALTMMKGE